MVDEKYQVLLDLTETARVNDFNMDVVMAKFPELQGVDRQLLNDFVETARVSNYDMQGTLDKFPEFTGKYKGVFDGGGNIYYGDAIAPRSGMETYDIPEVAEGQTIPMSTLDPAQAARIQSNLDQGVPVSQWMSGDFDTYVKTDEYAQAAAARVAEEEIQQEKRNKRDAVNRNSAEAYLAAMDNAAKEAEFEDVMQNNRANPISHFMLSDEAKIGHLMNRFESGDLNPSVLPNGQTVEAVAIPDLEKFEEEYGSIYDTRSTEEIKEEKKKEEELEEITADDPINIEKPETFVNKDTGEVLAYFNTPEAISKFPGLRVVTDNRGLVGNLDHKVMFILPDGTEIEMDLSPNMAGFVGSGLRGIDDLTGGALGAREFDEAGRQGNVEAEANKLREVISWYEKNSEHVEYMQGIEAFRMLGDRTFQSGFIKFDEKTLEQANAELGLIGLEIKTFDTLPVDLERFGPAGIGALAVKHATGTGPSYKLVDTSTKEELASGSPSEIQNYLWSKVPNEKWQAIRDNNADTQFKIFQRVKQEQDITYEEATTEDGLTNITTELSRQADFEDKFNIAIETMDLSPAAKLWLKIVMQRGTGTRGGNRSRFQTSEEYNREYPEGTFQEQSPSMGAELYAYREREEFYGASVGVLYQDLVRAVNNGTLEDLIAVSKSKPDESRYWEGEASMWDLNFDPRRSDVPILDAEKAKNEEIDAALAHLQALGYNVEEGRIFIPQAEREKVFQELTKLLQFHAGTDGLSIYNGVFDENTLYNEALNRSILAGEDFVSILNTKYNDDNYAEATVLNEETGEYEKVSVKPEMLANIINSSIRDPEYLKKLATTTDPFLDNMTGNFDALYNRYEERGEEIRTGFEQDIEDQLDMIAKAGLGYTFTSDGRPIIEGADEALVNKWQSSINKVFLDHYKLQDEWYKGLQNLNGKFRSFHSAAGNMGSQVNAEYDKGTVLAKDFRGAVEAFTNDIPAFFGSKSAVLAGQSRQRGEAAYERMLDYSVALEEGLGWRYSNRVMAQQSVNMGVAIGTNLVLPGSGMWVAPTLFGMSAGGQQRIAIQNQMDTGEKAKKALQSLEIAYENNEITRSEYINGKADLEDTIALGDLNWAQRNGSVMASAIIEGGITYSIGTVPNARAAIKNLSGAVDDLLVSAGRSRPGAIMSFLGNTGKQIGGEILEEELIYFANELQAGLLTGREMDFSQWKEVAVASLIMAGPTNTATTAYGTYVQQVANEEWMQENGPRVDKLKTYTDQLRSGKLDANEAAAIRQAMVQEAAALGMAMTGLEVDALVAGTTSVQELLNHTASENSIHRKAGVKPGDKPRTIKKKVNKYLSTLSKTDRISAEAQLKTISDERARIWEEISSEYNNDVLGKEGLVNKIYGQSGVDIANQMQDSNSSKYNPKFNRMSNKQKMMAIHDQLKSDQMQAEVDKAKSNDKIFKMMERAVYGYEGGTTKTKAGKKRTKRKKKAEQEFFERVAAWGMSTRGQAISINAKGRESAKSILNEDILTGLNEDAIVEFENAEEMALDVLNNWKKRGYKDEHTAKEAAEKIRSGKIAAQVTTNPETGKVQYITLDKAGAKAALENGDLLQGTAFAHEIGHVLDSYALNETETRQLAESIYNSLNGNKILMQVNALAIARMTDPNMTEDAKTRLKDESGRRSWHPKKNPVDFSKMSARGIDEYIKAVQDVFMNGNHEVAKAKARKVGKQGIGNLWRQATGFGKADFKFDSKGSGLNYLMGFIDAFDNAEISQQTKRKIAAKKAVSSEQAQAMAESKDGMGAQPKTSERAEITRTQKEASQRVQDVYDQLGMDGIQDIISEFEVIVNPNEGRGPRAYGTSIVEKYVKRLEVDEVAGHLGSTLQERRNAIAQAIYLDQRGIYGMVQKYNDDGNIRTDDEGNPVPLAGYINKYIEVRADEIVNDLLKEKAEGRVDHKYDNMADVPSDDSVAEQERKSEGVKLYDRFGEDGLDIHNSIVADVLNGVIDVDGKNYKTLGGKRFYQVMEMMGIKPTNKAGKPKTGNLDATDVTNAQRWIQKNIQSVRGAVIPMHSTTKMVKNPKTGKLEARPDKAIGIPGVLLNSPLFTKHTRKDNLTTYSFNDQLTDAQIMEVFGITERGKPNLKPKDDRNIGQKIRGLVKLVDMAMTNQSSRVAMEMQGSPISEILRVADGRNLSLFSEKSAAPALYDYLTETPIDVVQDQVYDAIQIAHKHGWGNAKFNQAIVDAGIDQAVIDYMEHNDANKFFVEQNEEGFRDPIRAKIKEGLKNPKEAEFWKGYLADQLYYSEDGQKKVGEKANKQLATAAVNMINTLPPKVVKALGKSFFGLVSSKRGLNKKNNQDVYDAFDARVTKESLAADDTVLDFNVKDIRKINAGNGLALKIQRILNEPRPKGKTKAQHALDKQQKVERLYGKEIDAANEANSKALSYVINKMATIGSEGNMDVKLGAIRLLEMATNNVLGFRGLTNLSMIQFAGESQAVWVGKNKKTGKLKYFDTNPTAADRNSHDVNINEKHPDYKEAVKHSKEAAEKKSKTKTGKWKKGWNQDRVNKEAELLIPKRLRAKGEHITPSANLMRTIALELSNVWFNGGNISLATENAMLNFSQSLGTEIYSKVQDEALGTTSMADLARMAAIQNYGGLNVESFRNPRTGEQYSSILKSAIANEQQIKETAEALSKVRQGDPIANDSKRNALGPIAQDLTDMELKQLEGDIVKAETVRNSEKPRGMTAWDFDDTLAHTKSNVIFTKDGETKTVSAEDFAKDGARLVEEGWVPDFSEFNKVTDGKPGPMFDKAMERARKYGTEDTYILTARAPESAVAIKQFLDALGLNIPLENITGLGNSTGEAKARWLLNKHAEGYNDIAFADDAMQNIEAVQKVFDQYDIKGKVEQAKVLNSERAGTEFSDIMEQSQSQLDLEFNEILGQTKGVDARKRFSDAKARQRGKGKGRFKFFLPPSAEDFKGLMYSFMGKGKQGEAHQAWFKEKLFDPFSRGTRRLNALKQEISNDVRSIKKAIPKIKGKLRSKAGNTEFTNEQAVRVFNWNRNGVKVPGLSRADLNALVKAVNDDIDLKAFADEVEVVSNKTGADSNPGNNWLGGTISSDLSEQIDVARETIFSEFLENSRAVFSKKNMNKIEAVYGKNFREAF